MGFWGLDHFGLGPEEIRDENFGGAACRNDESRPPLARPAPPSWQTVQGSPHLRLASATNGGATRFLESGTK